MRWIKAAWSEVIGLFVDDGSLAGAVLVWLGVCWLLCWLGLSSIWVSGLLFVGLVMLLGENALRRAGKRS